MWSRVTERKYCRRSCPIICGVPISTSVRGNYLNQGKAPLERNRQNNTQRFGNSSCFNQSSKWHFRLQGPISVNSLLYIKTVFYIPHNSPVSTVLHVLRSFSFPRCTVTPVNNHGLLEGRTERITTMYTCCDITGSLLLGTWPLLSQQILGLKTAFFFFKGL